jgi:hypothetical protein
VAKAVSSGAIDGDRVHGQGLGSVDREGLDRRVLDGESIAIPGLVTVSSMPQGVFTWPKWSGCERRKT